MLRFVLLLAFSGIIYARPKRRNNDNGNKQEDYNLCLSQYECLKSFITKNAYDDTYTICVWWDTNPDCSIQKFDIKYNDIEISEWYNGYKNKLCVIVSCDEQITFDIGNDRLTCSQSQSLTDININNINANCNGMYKYDECEWKIYTPKCATDTSICDTGFKIKNATFLFDISEEIKYMNDENTCDELKQQINDFEAAKNSLSTNPNIRLHFDKTTTETELFISLKYDICYDKTFKMIILYDVSSTKSNSECIKQQKHVANTILSLMTNTNTNTDIQYIEFKIDDSDYLNFVLTSTDFDTDSLFYRAIINRQTQLCYDTNRQTRQTTDTINLQISNPINQFDEILTYAIDNLLQAGDREKKLIIFSNDAISKEDEIKICKQHSDKFKTTLQAPPTPPPPPGNPNPQDLPQLPNYIDLVYGFNGNQAYRIVIDFTILINGIPRIRLPVQFLGDLPWYDNEIIIPTQFCGLRIIRGSRFIWFDQGGNALDDDIFDFPYNYVEEESSINQKYGINSYLGGIEFTGPIGACENSGNWVFPWPFKDTQSQIDNLKLVIELEQDSEIEFLNYNIHLESDQLKAIELFSTQEFDSIIKFWNEILADLNAWIERVCDESPQDCPQQGDGGNNNELIEALIINNELMIDANPSTYLTCLIGNIQSKLFINVQNFKFQQVENDENDMLMFYNSVIIPQIQFETCKRHDFVSSDVIDSFIDTIKEPVASETECKGKIRCTKRGFCVQRCGFLHWKFGKL